MSLFRKVVGLIVLVAIVAISLKTIPSSRADTYIDVWWPTENVTVSGTQPFKAMLKDYSVNDYQMFWQVDGDKQNPMYDSSVDYPHKEAMVDLSTWNWRGRGPYRITFVAKKADGSTISQRDVTIFIPEPATGSSQNQIVSMQIQPATTPAQTTTQSTTSTVAITPPQVITPTYEQPQQTTQPIEQVTETQQVKTEPPQVVPPPPAPKPEPVVPTNSANPIRGAEFYVNPHSTAADKVAAWLNTRLQDAIQMSKIAKGAESKWFGDWNGDIQNDVKKYVSQVTSLGYTPVMIAYNVPGRDCGSYSAGGSSSDAAYKNWINGFANGIGNMKAVVILEPDALPGMDCLSGSGQTGRVDLLNYAITTLKSKPNTVVYVDAGNPSWKSTSEMASRLQRAGIEKADGFSLNVSNFINTDDNIRYGTELSSKLGGKHFVIDTSRNGSGSNGEWCNPSNRSLGRYPTTATGNTLIDAYLWLKVPGESDGNCNGGPNAGVFWESYALDLARNSR